MRGSWAKVQDISCRASPSCAHLHRFLLDATRSHPGIPMVSVLPRTSGKMHLIGAGSISPPLADPLASARRVLSADGQPIGGD
jgi:hypothetical protein